MKIIFIRHGMTKGNEEKRYIGSTDESLSPKGIEAIKSRKYPTADRIVSSPMKRCVETAQFIYNRSPEKFYDLRECSFGDFENKNFNELKNNNDYIYWLENNGTVPFPNGEDYKSFCRRCCCCFEDIITNSNDETIAFVIHGGTIMAILEKFAEEKKDFYAWQIKNGECLEFKKIELEDRFCLRFISMTLL